LYWHRDQCLPVVDQQRNRGHSVLDYLDSGTPSVFSTSDINSNSYSCGPVQSLFVNFDEFVEIPQLLLRPLLNRLQTSEPTRL
jgi:hypothetical protein